MRKFKKTAITLAIVVLLFFVLEKANVFSPLKNFLSTQPVVADETPVLIKEIKSIGQLITCTSYDEVVADSVITSGGAAFINSFNRLLPVPLLPPADKQIVLIGRGKVLAGVDFASLNDGDMTLKNDTLRLALPKAKILDAIINPSGFETFIEKGNWSENEVTLVKLKARTKMIERALQQNIIERADAKAKAVMKNFIGNLGFKHIVFY